MKYVLSFALIVFFSPIVAEAQPFNSAVEYLDFLSDNSKVVSKDMWDYTRSIAKSKSARKVEKKRQDLLQSIREAKRMIKAKKPFDDQRFIQQAYLQYLELNYTILMDDYEKIIDLEAIAEESYDEMEAYIRLQDEIDEKMKASSDSLNVQVERFAEVNNINLQTEQSKTGAKLERAGMAFDYYNTFYLIFFKAFLEENHFFASLESNDMAAAEQSRMALLAAAEEGMEKLRTEEAYSGDASLKQVCTRMMKHFQREAKLQMPKVISFYETQEEFNRLDEAMKSKRKRDITQEDVDAFNKAVEAYNSAVKTINKDLEVLNEKREDALKDWNDTVEDFLKEHAA